MHPCVIWLQQGAGKLPFRYCLREYGGRSWWGDLPCRGDGSRCRCPYPPQPGRDQSAPADKPPAPSEAQLALF